MHSILSSGKIRDGGEGKNLDFKATYNCYYLNKPQFSVTEYVRLRNTAKCKILHFDANYFLPIKQHIQNRTVLPQYGLFAI